MKRHLPQVNHTLSPATAVCVLRAERSLSPNTHQHTGVKQHRPNTHLIAALCVCSVAFKTKEELEMHDQCVVAGLVIATHGDVCVCMCVWGLVFHTSLFSESRK